MAQEAAQQHSDMKRLRNLVFHFIIVRHLDSNSGCATTNLAEMGGAVVMKGGENDQQRTSLALPRVMQAPAPQVVTT